MKIPKELQAAKEYQEDLKLQLMLILDHRKSLNNLRKSLSKSRLNNLLTICKK